MDKKLFAFLFATVVATAIAPTVLAANTCENTDMRLPNDYGELTAADTPDSPFAGRGTFHAWSDDMSITASGFYTHHHFRGTDSNGNDFHGQHMNHLFIGRHNGKLFVGRFGGGELTLFYEGGKVIQGGYQIFPMDTIK